MEKPGGQESYFAGRAPDSLSGDMHLNWDLKETVASSKNQRRRRIPSRGTIQAKAQNQKGAFLFLVQEGGRGWLEQVAKGKAGSYVTAGRAKRARKSIQGLSGCPGENTLRVGQAQKQGDLPWGFLVGQEGGGMEIRTGPGMWDYTLWSNSLV